MVFYQLLISFLFFMSFGNFVNTNESESKVLTFPVDNLPKNIPLVFSPGLISKGFHEFGISMSKQIDTIFYITSDRDYSRYFLISIIKRENGWDNPEISEFAKRFSVYSIFLSYDSERIYFSTNRPVNYNSINLTKNNNWYSEKVNNSWSEPVLINHWFNKNTNDRICSVSGAKNIYLTREVDGRGTDIYYSKFDGQRYIAPIELCESINSMHSEGRPFIAPDESYIIFQSDRPGGIGGNDLWISFRDKKEEWSEPINFGEPVNSSSSEFAPYVSPDGNYLFFSSYRTIKTEEYQNQNYSELIKLYKSPQNGYATLFWLESSIITKIYNSHF